MVQNLPWLLVILLIGCSTTVISLTADSPQWLEWLLLFVGVCLSVWSMMGIILHLGIKKISND